jgi:hypothetical protein
MRLNRSRVIPGRGCVGGVVGALLLILPSWRGVRKTVVSRMALEKPAVAGDSPVDENYCSPFSVSQVAASP